MDDEYVRNGVLEVRYPEADKVVLVMDNLNTHNISSLDEAFAPEEAFRLAQRFGNTPHAQTWQLVEHRGNRIECAEAPMPAGAHTQNENYVKDDCGLESRTQYQTNPGNVAIHNSRRSDKTETIIPDIFKSTMY